MSQWERAILEGNQAFGQDRLEDAEGLYISACGLAKDQLDTLQDPEAAIMALVVSYQNLADLYFRCGDFGIGLSLIKDLHIELVRYLAQHSDCAFRAGVVSCARRRICRDLMLTVKQLELPLPKTGWLSETNWGNLGRQSTQGSKELLQ